MLDITSFLTEFLTEFKDDIQDYYNKSYSYLRDLISYKDINLHQSIKNENKSTVKKTLEKMLKAIKTGLNTIGLEISKLNEIQKNFLEIINNKKPTNYNSYFKLYNREFTNKILFEFLIEYLLDLDNKKIENLVLFNLLPQTFKVKLDQFKNEKIKSFQIKQVFDNKDLSNYIDFSNMKIKVKPITTSKESMEIIKENKINEIDILKQLQKAKEDSIEKIKVKPTANGQTDQEGLLSKNQPITQQDLISKLESSIDKITTKPIDYGLQKAKKAFFEYYGNFPQLPPDLINKIKINIVNFLNSRTINPDFLDLENIFYYISILKMLSIEFPFTIIEIVDLIKNFVNRKIFSSSKDDEPDPINNFYGIAILKELKLLETTEIINLQDIEQFIIQEFKKFIPEKLKLNYFTFLCLLLLNNHKKLESDKSIFVKQINDFNIFNLEEFNPPSDIFHQLATLKIIDHTTDLSQFKDIYIIELKKFLEKNGSIGNSITETAKTILILYLLDSVEQEKVFYNKLLTFLVNNSDFFKINDLNKSFNWRSDKLAYKIELKMLYWTLLAFSQSNNS